ncbi:hypothetical protein D1J51_05045 [Leucobacter sp. wl10]|nr:hypothetical protein D1J51_05045 [Leucobacter sp. wl10]
MPGRGSAAAVPISRERVSRCTENGSRIGAAGGSPCRTDERAKRTRCRRRAPVLDGPNLVSSAGLAPVLGLADRAGLDDALAALTIDSPNAEITARSVVAGMLAAGFVLRVFARVPRECGGGLGSLAFPPGGHAVPETPCYPRDFRGVSGGSWCSGAFGPWWGGTRPLRLIEVSRPSRPGAPVRAGR